MKKFVFYTFEGYTESPTGKTVENIQILGFENGQSEAVARNVLLKNNKWIIDSGFNQNKIVGQQLLDDELKGDINKLLDYNWEAEEKHYEENEEKNHIFLVLKKIKSKLN